MLVHVLASQATRHGGADVYTSDLVTRLAARGVALRLFCFAADDAIRQSVPTHLLTRGAWDRTPVVWRIAPALQPLSVWRDLRRRREPAPDVVLGMAHQIIWAHRQVYGNVPLVYLPHSLIAPVEVATYRWSAAITRREAERFYYREEQRSLARAHSTIRFTQAAWDALRSFYELGPSVPFAIVPPPVDFPSERQTRESAPVTRLLAVGRLVHTKNFGFLVDALSGMQDASWELELLGEGEEGDVLRQRVASAGLSHRIHFRGHTDPGPYYRRADLLVMPSVLESAGLVVVEAMVHGVPALAFRSDGVRFRNSNDELIDDGRTGFLVTDEAEFTSVLRRLIANRDTLHSAGSQARTVALRRHSWDAHLLRMEQLLAEAAAAGIKR